jgi:hypothetical protein
MAQRKSARPEGIKSPVKRQRVKTGCLPCRQRRKKCDEIQPICTGCTRNHLICAWSLDARLKQRATATDKNGAKPATSKLCTSSGATSRPCFKARPRHPDGTLLSQLSNSWGGMVVKSGDQRLLQHYIENTSRRLSAIEDEHCPFTNILVSMAFCENAVLHGLIALSASHLSFKEEAVVFDARSHYAICLRSVKYEITRVVSGDEERVLPLFTLLMLLCLFEIVDGTLTGAMASHVRAATAILPSFWSAANEENERLHTFLLDQYFYYSFVADNLGLSAKGRLPYKPVIDDLTVSIRTRVQQSSTQNVMFGQCFKLFEIIPKVTEFAYRPTTTYPRHEDPEIKHEFYRLEAQVLAWRAGTPIVEKSTINWHEFNAEVNVGLLVQCAILIFLRAALCGSATPPGPVYDQIQSLVEDFMRVSKALTLAAKPRTTLLWPDLIVGSCVLKDSHRSHLLYCLEQSHFEMHSMTQAAKLLRLLWDEDGYGISLFGPYGLNEIAHKYNMYLSVG